MRRHIMLALVFLGLATAFARPVSAQSFGILGGVTFADLTGDGVDEDLDGTNGYMVGALARIPLGEIITVQPEVQYVRKGASGEDLTDEFEVNLDYIDVPIFLSFGIPTAFGFHVMAGPNFSFEVGCDFESESVLGEVEGECDEDDEIFGERKSFIAGVAVGAGVDVPLGGMGLLLDGRFVIDLESFSEDDDFEIKNQVFEIVAGLTFGGN